MCRMHVTGLLYVRHLCVWRFRQLGGVLVLITIGRPFEEQPHAVDSMAFLSGSTRITGGCDDGTVHTWNVRIRILISKMPLSLYSCMSASDTAYSETCA